MNDDAEFVSVPVLDGPHESPHDDGPESRARDKDDEHGSDGAEHPPRRAARGTQAVAAHISDVPYVDRFLSAPAFGAGETAQDGLAPGSMAAHAGAAGAGTSSGASGAATSGAGHGPAGGATAGGAGAAAATGASTASSSSAGATGVAQSGAGSAAHTSGASLRVEVRAVRPSEKPYECVLCKRTFRRRHHLVDHVRTHTGEKPFRCDTCGACFRQRGTLTVHRRTHGSVGIKTFECPTCCKKFNHKVSLTRHCKRHAEESDIASFNDALRSIAKRGAVLTVTDADGKDVVTPITAAAAAAAAATSAAVNVAAVAAAAAAAAAAASRGAPTAPAPPGALAHGPGQGASALGLPHGLSVHALSAAGRGSQSHLPPHHPLVQRSGLPLLMPPGHEGMPFMIPIMQESLHGPPYF